MTTHSQKLQKVREWIVKANPEIVSHNWAVPHDGVPLFQQFNAEDGKLYRPIRLADVLLSIYSKIESDFSVWPDDRYMPPHGTVGEVKKGLKEKYNQKIIPMWNLRTDDLDHQSPDTIDFLLSLQQ